MHRLDGPAYQGKTSERYYIMGKLIEKKNFLKEVRLFKCKAMCIYKEN